jgi:hypothetical protein
MREYKEELIGKIENLISGKWTVSEFRNEYYDYYLNVPNSVLNMIQNTFFGLIQENLDWTGENPLPDEKQHGWMSHIEYVSWVKENSKLFFESEQNWYKHYLSSLKK